MAGFRKAKAEQAALKIGMYGPPGSGKTFTALLIAEGLSKITGKRVAYVDTEHGTDFYCQDVPARKAHPGAFDFDAIYTRSMMDVLRDVKQLDAAQYGVVVLDSITHLWEACIASYSGKQTSVGSIPFHAWGKIKKPYKDLMAALLGSPMHVIICGRQGTEYATDEETDELKAVGVKMKAEGETPYEPHILIRMEAIKPKKTGEVATIIAYAEKDRTGVLAGRSIANPTFETIAGPLLGLLGATQAQVPTGDEVAGHDAEVIAEQERQREAKSQEIVEAWSAKITLAVSVADLKAIGSTITPQLKAQMLPSHVAELREKYQAREQVLERTPPAPTESPQHAPGDGQAAYTTAAPANARAARKDPPPGLTLVNALAAVKRGEIDQARDIGLYLSIAAREEIEAAINAANAAREQDLASQA